MASGSGRAACPLPNGKIWGRSHSLSESVLGGPRFQPAIPVLQLLADVPRVLLSGFWGRKLRMGTIPSQKKDAVFKTDHTMYALNSFVLVPILISYALAAQTNLTQLQAELPKCAVSRITLHMSALRNEFSAKLYRDGTSTLGLSVHQSYRRYMYQCRVTAKFFNVCCGTMQ